MIRLIRGSETLIHEAVQGDGTQAELAAVGEEFATGEGAGSSAVARVTQKARARSKARMVVGVDVRAMAGSPEKEIRFAVGCTFDLMP